MKKTITFFRLLPVMMLAVMLISANGAWGQTSTQNFGTGTGSHTSQTGSNAFLPNPTSGTTWARAGVTVPNAPVVLANTSNPLGTTGSYVRAAASTSTSVTKFSPWVAYTGGKEFYTSFKVLFGDASAGSTATSGSWTFYQGAGAMYSDASDFAGAQVFSGLRFTYGAGGALALTYRGGSNWINTSLTTSTFSSATVYNIEIVGNNKTSGTINYTYNGAAQTVAVQKFDLYINGTKIGDDLAEAALPADASITSGTFIGISSTSNVANIFVDDAVTYNAVPVSLGSLSASPTLTAASSPTVDAAFDVTFTDDAASQAWVSAGGTAVTVGGTPLTAGYAITNGKITFTPSASVPAGLLQTAGASKAIVISKTGYTDASVPQTIVVGAAAKLGMKAQPTAPSVNGGLLATQPKVDIQDQYGNTTTSTASVTAAVGAGTWTIGGKTAKAGVSGTATFTDLTATSAAAVTGATISFTSGTLTGVTSGAFNIPAPPLNAPVATSATSVSASGFTANWDAVSGATEYYLDVATNPSFINSNLTTIVGWNFPNNPDDATADIGISENSSKNLTTNAVSSITFTPMTNPVSTTSVASAFTPNTWADGMGSKYWEIEFSTSGYTIIRFSSLQRSSNSGPRDFKVQYKIGSNGTFSDVPGGTITVANDWSTGQLSNISLPGTCDNQSSVYLRWIMSSNTGVNGSAVANTGTSSIDNIIIESNGTSNIISGYDNLLVSGTSQTVTGLSPNTTYYYVVRATSASNTSANSNTVTAFTAIDGVVNASAMPDCPTCDVVVANGGTLTVDATKTYNSVVIAPQGHLTLNDTKTLSVSGNLTIQSDANGTGTLVDANAAGGLTVTGTTNVEQWLTVARQWWYLSSPLSAAKTTTFTPSNKIGTYDEATSTYSNPLATDVSLEVGRGYVVKLSDADDKAYTFTGGNLNTGDKTLTLTRTGNTAPKRGFNLVGNPYPSYLDWNLVFDPATATNMRNAIWFRTYDTTESTMAFHTYSDGDGVPDQASSLIAPMQAFWVKVDADPATNETVSNGSLTFKNTHRSHFVTGANPLKVKALDARPRLRLVVSNGTATDEMLVVGKPYASDALDSYDIGKFSNDNNAIPEVYSVVSNQELVINSMNALTEGKTVTLGFRPGQTGTNFTIEATQLDNIDAKVMLLDKVEETEQELTAGTSYSFEVTDATPTTDRFVISLVSKVPTGVETSSASGDMAVYANRNNRIQVIYRGELNDQTAVSVYNVAGQKLSTQKVVKAATELSGTFNPGVYMIQLTDNGKKITQKLIIK